jgi:hypothetical protein
MNGIQVATIPTHVTRGETAQIHRMYRAMFAPPHPTELVVSLAEHRLQPLVERKIQSTASAMIEAGLGKAEPRELLGRVAVIDVEPRALPRRPSIDPPIPVVLADMGFQYDMAARQYVRHILTRVGHRWSPWYRKARRRLARVVDLIPAERLTRAEHQYLVVMLEHLAANYRGQIAT